MSFLSSIKNALIEEDISVPHAKEEPVIPKAASVASATAYATTFAQTLPYVTPTQAPSTSSGKMKEVLSSELLKNLAGSPYLQFQKMNAGMKLKISDASTRLSAIAASMEVQGIAKQSILDGANGAVAFLNNESTNFQAELNSDLQRLEQEFKARTDNIALLLEQKQNQIKSLSEEISNLQKDKSNTEVQAQEDKTRIEVSRIEFQGSLSSILLEIKNDINDITTHLGA